MPRIDIPAGEGPEVTRTLSLVPHFVPAVSALEKAVWASPLPRRLHELVRMRIAEINGCVLCMTWRNDWADEESLAAVSQHATSDRFSDAERVAIEYAERFATDSQAIDGDLLARLNAHFSPAEIVDLTLVLGKYLALGRFMQVLDLDQACTIAYDAEGKLITARP
ncbi:MAG TPA: carboxymuconolactone decarboxylase family protein [Acidimicrobiales bacterium]